MNFNEPFWLLLPTRRRLQMAKGLNPLLSIQPRLVLSIRHPKLSGSVGTISEVLSVLGGWELCEVKTKGEPHDSGTGPQELLFEQTRL